MNAPRFENSDPSQPEYFEDDIHLADYLIVLLKRKKMIMGIVACAIILSVIWSLLKPNVYTATARILPPGENSSGLSNLLAQSGGLLGGLGVSIPGAKSTADIYVGILESRTVADILIKKYDLKAVFEQEFMENVYRELAARTKTQVSRKTQIISVSVEDEDPERAADMANAYVAALDHMNRTVNVTESQQKRMFLETRLQEVKKDLVRAETELREFQEKYKLVSIDEQARIAIEGAAKIKGEITAAQTELEVLKKFGTERQNEAIMLKSRIGELRKQLAKIETGNQNKNGDSFYIPFNEIPALGMQLVRLVRETKIQEKVFELITTQYELAKIEEAKDMNTIQTLDRAQPPDRKSGPKRALIVVLSTIIAFFVSVFLAFFLEYLSRLKIEDQERYQALMSSVRFRKPR